MSLTAYVRYDNTGRIVPGGPIVTSIKPKVGDWIAVNDIITTTPNYKLRGFIRYIKNGNYVAGSLILQHDEPKDGNWKEVYVLKPVIDNVSYYNVAGCERMEYHVIKYIGAGTLAEGTIVSNATPECWFVIDQATGPEDVGTIQQIWNTESNCQPCIDAHFSDEIYYGEDTPTACSQTIPIYARGNGTTFCNSDNFYSESFRTVGTGTIIISYEGQQKVVGVTSGSDLATYYGGCAACPPFTTIIISNGSYTPTNGTYTRPNVSTAFSQEGGTGSIFFGGDAWYLNAGVFGNVARNTSTLGTGTWEPWAPGNSSGITAEYLYS